jgi:hypothetical protein
MIFILGDTGYLIIWAGSKKFMEDNVSRWTIPELLIFPAGAVRPASERPSQTLTSVGSASTDSFGYFIASVGKWPLVLTARRSFAFKASMAFVV